MAGQSGIRAGKAYMEIATRDKLSAGLKKAQRQMRAFAAGVQSIGFKVSAVSAAAIVPLGVAAIKAASNAEEGMSRFNQVFGREAGAAGTAAEQLAKRVGRSAVEIRDTMSTFQSFFVGLGFGTEHARKLTEQLSALSIDFASFNNLSDREGTERFISALSGSSEVLDRFGINIKQAALQQELLAMGSNKAWSAVTEQEKATARLNVIMRAMGDQGAMGDAVRTSGSFANRMKRLRGEMQDTAVAIGQAILPTMSRVVSAGTNVIRAVGEIVDRNPGLVRAGFAVGAAALVAGTALIGLGSAAALAAFAAGGLASTLGVVGLAVSAVLSPIGLVTTAAVAMGTAIVTYSGLGGEAVRWLGEQFAPLLERWKPVIDAISESLSNGDIVTASRQFWAGLEAEWTTGTATLDAVWAALSGKLATTMNKAMVATRTALAVGIGGMRRAWAELVTFLAKIWDRFVTATKKSWETVTTKVAKGALDVQAQFDPNFSTEDARAGKKLLDEQLAARRQELDDQLKERLGVRDADLEDKLDEISTDQFEAFKSAVSKYSDAAAEISDNTTTALIDAGKKLEEAETNLADALASNASAGGGEDAPGGGLVDRLDRLLGGLHGAMDQAGLSSRGTFSAAAVRDLGGRDAEIVALAKDLVASSSDLVSSNAKIARNTSGGGSRFT